MGPLFALFSITLAAFYIPIVTPDPNVPEFITITGRVTDEAGEPILQAHITWGTEYFDPTDPPPVHEAYTDADGQYRIVTDQTWGEFRLKAYAPGYAPYTMEHMPQPDSDIVEFNIKLGPTHTISGVVFDDQGTSLNAVKVSVKIAESEFNGMTTDLNAIRIPGPAENWETTTGADGRFHFDGLPPGEVVLDFDTPHRHINQNKYEVDREHRIVMRGSGKSGDIYASVMDSETLKPVLKYSVVRRHDPNQIAIDDPTGILKLSGLQAEREYQIHIYAPGYAAWHGDLTASSAEQPELQPVMLNSRPPVRVRLCTPDRKFISGARILGQDMSKMRYLEWSDYDRLVDGRHGANLSQRAVTDENGVAIFACEDDLSSWGLVISCDGYGRCIVFPDQQPDSLPGQEWNIILEPEAVVTGRFVDKQGNPARVDVSVWRSNPDRSRAEEYFESVSTGEDGSFRYEKLSAGPHNFYASYKLGNDASTSRKLSEFTLESGQVLDLGTMIYDPMDIYKDKDKP